MEIAATRAQQVPAEGNVCDDVASGLYFALIMTDQGERVLTFAVAR